MTNEWIERYLNLLGVRARAPTLETLTELASAHRAVAFANAPSLIRRAATPHGPVPALDTEDLLLSWQAGAPTGVCYEITTMLEVLLEGMGFDSHVVLAAIGVPREHQANIITLEGRRFMLDLGNGAPLYEPIPIDEGPYEIHLGGLGYRFDRQSSDGQLVQSRRIDNEWRSFAVYENEPARPAERVEAFQIHHTLPAMSFVMGSFTLVQTHNDEVLALRTHTFTHYKTSGKTTREIAGIDAYRGLVRDEFGLPDFPIDEGLAAWSKVTGNAI